MDSKELRNKFIDFYKSLEHQQIAPAKLVPENDASVLFTTAGMQQLVPFLLGQKHPSGEKLVNIQPCIRTDDIDEVGDETHLTFFEMLGYWSLGDYWKKEAIESTFNFFTKELGFDKEKLGVTCFEGDLKNNIPRDTESAEIWNSLGIKRIAYLGYKDNFWGPTSVDGPCGPDTEVFIWSEESDVPEEIDITDKNWIEIGNDVFMQYQKIDDKYEPLDMKNVDFGAGFERLTSFIENKNIFETELFLPIIKKIEEISGKNYSENEKEFRIIADHIKAAVFAINDSIIPSNKEQGYVVRRLIRRAIVKAKNIGIEISFTKDIAEVVFRIYDNVYEFKKEQIILELEKEETNFRKTLKDGLKILKSKNELTGEDLFNLYQSYGIPVEISTSENIKVAPDALTNYQKLYQAHQEKSKTAGAGIFKGGLQSGGSQETKFHTATHLLHSALRYVLGDGVYQRGSNINSERLRFDFSYPDKMTEEQIKEVESIVNENIKKDLAVTMEEMSVEDAKNSGAIGIFDSKYGDKVKVYTIGSGGNIVSKEICGGPHVKRTSELGHFKITKEESSSSGVRRIKAILE
jgi:alanyl-tRNA synthetase